MKKIFVFGLLLFGLAFSVFAQGFYFDAGLGIGKAWTKVNDIDFADALSSEGIKFSEIGAELGLKAGYGPFGTVPVYVVGELAGMGHRFTVEDSYIQLNSYLIGPGVIYYPIPLIQLSAGLGFSFAVDQSNIANYESHKSKGGFAWNIAAAVDLGKRNHGCLLGLKFFNAINELQVSNELENTSMISVFVKYTYRHKVSSSF
jgi:hypothetical protein